MLVLLAAGSRVWHAALLAPVAASLFLVAVRVSPYRMNRILAYLNPFDDAEGIGYHIIQAMTAVAGGGLAGRGIGNSIQKFGYLPEDTTDFIFAIICEEMGAAGAAAVVFLYVALLVCAMAIVDRTPHPFHRLLGLGIVLTIGLQAVINIAVVTAVAPTKGIALPLLSAGGTGWVLTAFSLGLLVSMDRANERRVACDESHRSLPAAGAPRMTGTAQHDGPPMRRVLFAGGGSGGHISPALAIAERVTELAPASTCLFACSRRAVDAEMLGDAGARFVPIDAAPVSMRPRGLARFLVASRRARRQAI